MDKGQALFNFWSKFGLPAYDENTVPDDAPERYITYNTTFDSIGNVVNLYGNIWDINSNSWEFVSKKAEEISEYLAKMHPISYAIDNGRLYLAPGKPFAQRMSDPTGSRTAAGTNVDDIRRMYINIQAEFLTAF